MQSFKHLFLYVSRKFKFNREYTRTIIIYSCSPIHVIHVPQVSMSPESLSLIVNIHVPLSFIHVPQFMLFMFPKSLCLQKV